MEEILYGAFSGFAQNMIGLPLDSIKIWKQTGKPILYKNILRYYHGFSYTMTSQVICNSSMFYILNKADKMINNKYISGFATGVIITPLVFSFDVAKVLNQISNTPLKIRLNDIIKSKGKLTTLSRESLALNIYFGIYYDLKNQGISNFNAGGFAGMCNWFITYPLDIIRNRQIAYQINFKKAYYMGNLTNGLFTCLLRAYIVNAVGFQTYEYSKSIF